jgi:hypothetical protein
MLVLITRQSLGVKIVEAIQSESIYRIKPNKIPDGSTSVNKSIVVTIKGEELYSDETVEQLWRRINGDWRIEHNNPHNL